MDHNFESITNSINNATSAFNKVKTQISPELAKSLEAQLYIYAAFVTDLKSGAIQPSEDTKGMLVNVGEFCDLLCTEAEVSA